MSGFDLQEAKRKYMQMQPGDARMRAIRMNMPEAERSGDRDALWELHHDLIYESVFSGDRYQALIDFPQYLALVRSDPQLEAKYAWDTLWLFKWIVEAAVEFYQIEKAQVHQWFSEYRREMRRYGYSLRPFYEKRAIFHSYCDRAMLRLDYEDFKNAPRDGMCDGEADEYDATVRWELAIGSREKAMEAAEYIFRNRLESDEIPATTYGYLLSDAMTRGDEQDAAHYAGLLRPLCDGERFRLEQTGLLLCYDAVYDTQGGLAFYRKNARLREGSHNPFLSFWFDRGASRLLKAAAGNGAEQAGQLMQLADSAAQSAAALAERFDARNGSDYFTRALTAAG